MGFTFERVAPEAVGVDPAAIQAFLDRAEAEGIDLHSVMLLRHGKVCFEKWWAPHSPEEFHDMWSFSKSLTSTAIGFAIQEGKLALEDRLVEIFPDKLPETVSENLGKATVRDLLTMSCGHEAEHTNEIRYDESEPDWVKHFLSFPVERRPGTFFCYNTIGTYMLSAIVTKVTGEKIVDYLQPRLWEPLAIEKPYWKECPKGINFGGWGLYLKTEDMAKTGQMLLQKGQWKGKQVLPAEWVAEMSKCQIDNRPEDFDPATDTRPDWHQGYCYQMWRCRHNAYRADGAYGQYIIVLPEKDAVIAVTAEVKDMQVELSLIWDCLLPVL